MNRNAENPYASHDNVALLLPWYANKTLRGSDLNAVEQHLKICLVCNRELLALQKIANLIKEPAAIDSNAQASFSRFKNRLSAIDNGPLPILSKPLDGVKTSRPHFSRPVFAMVATVLLTVFLARFVDVRDMVGNDYRTLSNAETLATNANEVKVIFKPEASRQAIDGILAAIDGHIIDGSGQQSFYIIGFKGAIQKSEVLDKISFLRKNGLVAFAEPAYAFFSGQQPEQAK
jgi:hypothetical protein